MRISLLLFLPLFLFAMQGAVSVQVQPKSRYFVSEKIVLELDVKSTGFSVGDVRVDTSGLKDLIVIAPQSAAYVQSEEIDGESWQVAVYEYELYPLRGGEIFLAPLEVSFTGSMGYGQPKSAFTKSTEPFTLQVDSPDGIDGFVLSTPKLTLDVTYKPDPTSLKIGDAFERTVTIIATDVPDLLLPSVAIEQQKSLRLYDDEPRLSMEQGRAKRVEHQTIIASQEGNVTLPEQRLYWYDSVNGILHAEIIEAVEFEVSGGSVTAKSEEQGSSKTFWLLLGVLLLIAGSVTTLLYIIRYEKRSIIHLPRSINPRE